MLDLKNYNINDDIDEIIVETFNDGRPRLSVKPINISDNSLKVEFPKNIRTKYPKGTKFKVRVKLCQKHYLTGSEKGKPKGKPYLYSYEESIVVLN